MKYIATVTAAAALLMSVPAHAEDKGTDKDTAKKDYVILKVDGDTIKRSEVEKVWKGIFPGDNAPSFDSFDSKIKDNVLRGVASEHVVEKEADKSGVVDSADVKERIEQLKKQAILQEFLKEKAKELVTERDLKTAYDEKTKNPEDEVHARHILVKTETEAKEIEKKLHNGGDFEKIAKDKSEDKTSGTNGGDLGWFSSDKMLPEFSKAAFALKKGEVSQPVKTEFGWHVIKLEDRRKVTPPTFEEMKPHLEQELGNKAIGDYVNGLMKNVKITVLDENGKSTNLPPVAPAPGGTPTASGTTDKQSN